MKKIVPFKKEIIFKSNLSEITSISLEHNLHNEEKNLITGEFVISGDYRMNDNSENTESFSFDIPFDINMDEKYVLDKATIDINDFYYEIINNKVLAVNIEVIIDRLEEQPLITLDELIDEPILETDLMRNEKEEELVEVKSEESNSKLEQDLQEEILSDLKPEKREERCIEKEEVKKIEEIKERNSETVKSLFENITGEEEYVTYHVAIVRDGDTLESIMTKYNVTKEQMELYNDLKEIKIGVKLIIPNVKS